MVGPCAPSKACIYKGRQTTLASSISSDYKMAEFWEDDIMDPVLMAEAQELVAGELQEDEDKDPAHAGIHEIAKEADDNCRDG